MYDLTECPLCNKQHIRETPKDICSQILQQKDNVLKDSMSLRELCIRLMRLFDLTKRTACKYTNWLINKVTVYLPDRKHIRLIST